MDSREHGHHALFVICLKDGQEVLLSHLITVRYDLQIDLQEVGDRLGLCETKRLVPLREANQVLHFREGTPPKEGHNIAPDAVTGVSRLPLRLGDRDSSYSNLFTAVIRSIHLVLQ